MKDLSLPDRCPTCFRHKAYAEEYGFLYGRFPYDCERVCVFRCCDNYWTAFEENHRYMTTDMIRETIPFDDDRIYGYILIWCIIGALLLYQLYIDALN